MNEIIQRSRRSSVSSDLSDSRESSVESQKTIPVKHKKNVFVSPNIAKINELSKINDKTLFSSQFSKYFNEESLFQNKYELFLHFKARLTDPEVYFNELVQIFNPFEINYSDLYNKYEKQYPESKLICLNIFLETLKNNTLSSIMIKNTIEEAIEDILDRMNFSNDTKGFSEVLNMICLQKVDSLFNIRCILILQENFPINITNDKKEEIQIQIQKKIQDTLIWANSNIKPDQKIELIDTLLKMENFINTSDNSHLIINLLRSEPIQPEDYFSVIKTQSWRTIAKNKNELHYYFNMLILLKKFEATNNFHDYNEIKTNVISKISSSNLNYSIIINSIKNFTRFSLERQTEVINEVLKNTSNKMGNLCGERLINLIETLNEVYSSNPQTKNEIVNSILEKILSKMDSFTIYQAIDLIETLNEVYSSNPQTKNEIVNSILEKILSKMDSFTINQAIDLIQTLNEVYSFNPQTKNEIVNSILEKTLSKMDDFTTNQVINLMDCISEVYQSNLQIKNEMLLFIITNLKNEFLVQLSADIIFNRLFKTVDNYLKFINEGGKFDNILINQKLNMHFINLLTGNDELLDKYHKEASALIIKGLITDKDTIEKFIYALISADFKLQPELVDFCNKNNICRENIARGEVPRSLEQLGKLHFYYRDTITHASCVNSTLSGVFGFHNMPISLSKASEITTKKITYPLVNKVLSSHFSTEDIPLKENIDFKELLNDESFKNLLSDYGVIIRFTNISTQVAHAQFVVFDSKSNILKYTASHIHESKDENFVVELITNPTQQFKYTKHIIRISKENNKIYLNFINDKNEHITIDVETIDEFKDLLENGNMDEKKFKTELKNLINSDKEKFSNILYKPTKFTFATFKWYEINFNEESINAILWWNPAINKIENIKIAKPLPEYTSYEKIFNIKSKEQAFELNKILNNRDNKDFNGEDYPRPDSKDNPNFLMLYKVTPYQNDTIDELQKSIKKSISLQLRNKNNKIVGENDKVNIGEPKSNRRNLFIQLFDFLQNNSDQLNNANKEKFEEIIIHLLLTFSPNNIPSAMKYIINPLMHLAVTGFFDKQETYLNFKHIIANCGDFTLGQQN